MLMKSLLSDEDFVDREVDGDVDDDFVDREMDGDVDDDMTDSDLA